SPNPREVPSLKRQSFMGATMLWRLVIEYPWCFGVWVLELQASTRQRLGGAIGDAALAGLFRPERAAIHLSAGFQAGRLQPGRDWTRDSASRITMSGTRRRPLTSRSLARLQMIHLVGSQFQRFTPLR